MFPESVAECYRCTHCRHSDPPYMLGVPPSHAGTPLTLMCEIERYGNEPIAPKRHARVDLLASSLQLLRIGAA